MVEFRDGHIVDESYGDIPDGLYYTQQEFAELLDVPESTVRVWVNRGIVTCVRYYGRTYIPENVLFSYKNPWMRALRTNSMRVYRG